MSNSTINWILIGAPNSGKTSLFNKLTGLHEDVMNYPGSTATLKSAKLKKAYNLDINIIDTPGVYNLNGDTEEEIEVLNALSTHPLSPLIFVLDCRFLDHRKRFLSTLLKESFKCVVFCTHVSESNTDLNVLHKEYGVSFIDSEAPLAFKTLIYAVENINLQFSTQASIKTLKKSSDYSYSLDRLFLHPTLSFIFALIAILIIFSGAFYIGQPISHRLEIGIDIILQQISHLYFLQGHDLAISFISGCILGVGTLVVFIPQIFLLFLIILFIQDSGYLARAVIIFDPLLQKFGLHGKSFVSLLSGFSCAIPAILLSKTIESKKERLLTIFAVPFMVCSARVPMYAMCITFLFREHHPLMAGLAFSGCYFISLCLGVIAAGIVNKFIPDYQTSYFMMELPPYRLPNIASITKSASKRVVLFLKNAGPIILGFSLVIWVTTTFPNYDTSNEAERLKQSYAGQVGQWIEPALKPMGTDWRVGTAILTSFAAREVFVSSLTLLLGYEPAEIGESGLFKSLKKVPKEDGSPLFTPASMIALLVFFIFALQCSSTTAVTAKETNSWTIALCQFVIMNILAYTFAVITYQLISRF
ncbi:MAG: ferrous iron transporter B [Candidatus Paracaedibacteraceae bacterium]|nr:ferrous iron transporter B [Candidatus Paracaedibacteraceae bacterium]